MQRRDSEESKSLRVSEGRATPLNSKTEDHNMSLQAYLVNIKAKTGKSPDDFKRLAAKRGYTENGKLRVGIKAGEIFTWVKKILLWVMATQWRLSPYSKA
jgi:hypothetical protein